MLTAFGRAPLGLPQDVEKIALDGSPCHRFLRMPLQEARAALAALTPTVAKLAEQLAKETENLQKGNRGNLAEGAGEKAGGAQAQAEEKAAKQEKLNTKVDALKDMIRAEANQQNVLQKEGASWRAMRTMRWPCCGASVKAEQALRDAAQVGQTDVHEKAVREATAEQQKTRRGARPDRGAFRERGAGEGG